MPTWDKVSDNTDLWTSIIKAIPVGLVQWGKPSQSWATRISQGTWLSINPAGKRYPLKRRALENWILERTEERAHTCSQWLNCCWKMGYLPTKPALAITEVASTVAIPEETHPEQSLESHDFDLTLRNDAQIQQRATEASTEPRMHTRSRRTEVQSLFTPHCHDYWL